MSYEGRKSSINVQPGELCYYISISYKKWVGFIGVLLVCEDSGGLRQSLRQSLKLTDRSILTQRANLLCYPYGCQIQEWKARGLRCVP